MVLRSNSHVLSDSNHHPAAILPGVVVSLLSIIQMGLSENMVPLNPSVNHHVPIKKYHLGGIQWYTPFSDRPKMYVKGFVITCHVFHIVSPPLFLHSTRRAVCEIP